MEELFKQSDVEIESILKKVWNTEDLSFLGKLELSTSPNEVGYGYISNPYVNDRKIYYPTPVKKRIVAIRVLLNANLKLGEYYRISAKLAWLALRKEKLNPFLLVHDESKPLIHEADYLPPKEFINRWFTKKGENPEDAATIARQLKLNELELYTHTKRFVFELLQNADDMPLNNKPVSVEIILLQNFLLFLHNGKFFDRDDVKAICDAAKSTKATNIATTGYKGIGFKSVFTDSYRVFIKSGSYSFKFDKKNPIYFDFWKLYGKYIEGKNEGEKRLFIKEYSNRTKEFLVIENIPWQIKPIWVDRREYPNELVESPFFQNHQVALALEVGEETINDKEKNYHYMISQLLNEPRFLLFLRNTNELKYSRLFPADPGNETCISIDKKGDNLVIKKNDEVLASYLKKDFEISLNNEDFLKAGLNFKKTIIESKIVFLDLDGRKLENIPEKLINLEKTIISFAAKTEYSNIVGIGPEKSILFNYLPTSDNRFKLPFLVNADFVSKTDREFIQIENKWNHYIFYHIGKRLIEWLSELASINLNEKYYPYVKTYLQLLPDSLLDEENPEQGSINKAFNYGIKEGITEFPFIINSKWGFNKCSEIILDCTGFTNILGGQGINLFKKITNTNKEIPHFLLNENKLKANYLGIELFEEDALVSLLLEAKNQECFADTIKNLESEKYFKFLNWLEKFVHRNFSSKELVTKLPIIRIKNSSLSIFEALAENDFLFKTRKIDSILPVLEKVGFTLSEIWLDDYETIFSITKTEDNYLSKESKLFDLIAARSELLYLDPIEKNQLLVLFDSLAGVGKGRYAESFKIFKSQSGKHSLKALSSLIRSESVDLPSWLEGFVIDPEEEVGLSERFRNYLINEDAILDKIFCVAENFNEVSQEVEKSNIKEFYDYVLKLIGKKPEDKNLSHTSVCWLYSPKTETFHLPEELYCPDSLLKIKDETKFQNVCRVIEALTDLKTPHFSSIGIIEKLSLGCLRSKIGGQIIREGSFSLLATNDFFDWLKLNQEEDFFKSFVVNKVGVSFCLKKGNGVLQFYSDDQDLVTEVIKNPNIGGMLNLLPMDLYSNERANIGLLEGNKLLEYLLTNGMASVSFSRFVYNCGDEKIKRLFIENVAQIPLETIGELVYDGKSAEHKFIKIILDINDQAVYDIVRGKIFINGLPIAQGAVSDDIFFKDRGDLKIKLSQLILGYKEKASSVTSVMEKFPDIFNRDLKKIFELQRKEPVKIFKELHETETKYLNPYQTFFLILYQHHYSQSNPFQGKSTFVTISEDPSRKTEYETDAKIFLNLCFESGFFEYSKYFNLPDFHAKNVIMDTSLALPEELLPAWTNSWLQDLSETKEKKIAFLQKAGVNDGIENPVVQFRKGLLDKDFELFEKGRVNLGNVTLISNTISWLLEKEDNLKDSHTKSFIIPLFEKLVTYKISMQPKIIPVLNNYSEDSYNLIKHVEGNEYHKVNENWGTYGEEIFSHLKENGKFIIDGSFPVKLQEGLTIIPAGYQKLVDKNLLVSKSQPFANEYYLSWDKKDLYPISIYPGLMIPFKIIYNEKTILNFEEGVAYKCDGVLYSVYDQEQNIPFIFAGLMPADDALKLAAKMAGSGDRGGKTKKSENDLIKDYLTPEEIKELEALLKRQLSEDEMINVLIVALFRAIKHYEQIGFELQPVKDHFSEVVGKRMLKGIINKSTEEKKNVYVRSAKSGMLYMKFLVWKGLEEENSELFVITGNDKTDFQIFRNQEELSNANKDSWVFRLNGQDKYQELNSLLSGDFLKDNSKTWSDLEFYIRIKTDDYRSIFEQIAKYEKTGNFNNLD